MPTPNPIPNRFALAVPETWDDFDPVTSIRQFANSIGPRAVHCVTSETELEALAEATTDRPLYADHGGVLKRLGTSGGWVAWSMPATWNNVTSKPATFPPDGHTHAGQDINTGTIPVGVIPMLGPGRISGGTFPSYMTFASTVTANSHLNVAGNVAVAANLSVEGVSNLQGRLNAYGQVRLQGGADLTTSASANVFISSTPEGWGLVSRVTSARKYKTDIRDAAIPSGLLTSLRPRTWVDKAAKEQADADGDTALLPRHVGLVAEEVADAGGDLFVIRDGDGQPDALAYDRLIAAVVVWAKAQEARVAAAEVEVADFKARLAVLEGGAQ